MSKRVAEREEVSYAGRWVVLAALCATQITSWGVLYYAFPVLAGDITAGTGWSTPAITAALSASSWSPLWWGSWSAAGSIGTARVA